MENINYSFVIEMSNDEKINTMAPSLEAAKIIIAKNLWLKEQAKQGNTIKNIYRV